MVALHDGPEQEAADLVLVMRTQSHAQSRATPCHVHSTECSGHVSMGLVIDAVQPVSSWEHRRIQGNLLKHTP